MKEFPEKWKIDLSKLSSSQGDIISAYYSTRVCEGSTYNNVCKNFKWLKSHNNKNEYIDDKLLEKKSCSFSQDNYEFTEITFEEFFKYILKKEETIKTFSLEELKNMKPCNVFIETKEQWQVLNDTNIFKLCYYQGAYCYNLSRGEYSSSSRRDYIGENKKGPIIQFNQINFTQVIEKPIVGWKLTKKKYSVAALEIAQASTWFGNYPGSDLDAGSAAEDFLRNAGVLEMWFEPVYEKVVPKIEIKGYTAEFLPKDEVKFGCQIYTKDFIVQLNNLLIKQDFTILYNKESINPEINKLASYLQKC